LFASNIGKPSSTAQPKSEVSQQIAAPQQPSKVQLSAASPSLAVVQSRTYPHWSQLIIGAGFIAAVGAGTGYLFQVNDTSFCCQPGYHMLVNIPFLLAENLGSQDKSVGTGGSSGRWR
jgi:hypothetical protein